MSTRITFLGTAGENSVLAKYDKTAGGIILDIDDKSFLIDPGPGALIQASRMKFNLRENTAIILSSPRLEQCNDVHAVIDAMTVAGLDKRGVLLADMKAENTILREPYKLWLERLIHLEAGKRIGIEDVDLSVLPSTEKNACGISFFTPDGKITYTGNTSSTPEIIEQYKDSSLLIMNVFHPRGITSPGFLNTDDAITILKAVKPKLAVITHFGLKMIKAEPLYEAREIQRQTNIQVIAAKEGLTLSLTPYASGVIVK